MNGALRRREHAALAAFLVKWVLLGAWAGLLSGSASALFLWALDWATHTRGHFPWLLFFLPLVGVVIGALYTFYGKSVAGGTNLLLDRIHDTEGTVPVRMAPLILVTTVLTHLFGGSAGREGTAVQMGGTLADLASKPLKMSKEDRRILLMTGISGGFGSVFGTPLAGAVFGLEVLTIGRLRYDALIGCLVSSVVGDIVCRAWGIQHVGYAAPKTFLLTSTVLLSVLVLGVLFAAASAAFSELTHRLGAVGQKLPYAPYLRPVIGGVLVIGMTLIIGNQDYNGLSIPMIQQSFLPASVPSYAFLIKLVLTAVTLGFGFKGGEVTPLFCIGATLGGAFGKMTHQDPALYASLGFVAVFAGAANTPLACTIMGIELFGGHLAVPLALACVISYILSGHRGIYLSQRIHSPKTAFARIPKGQTLRGVLHEGFDVDPPNFKIKSTNYAQALSDAPDHTDGTP